jgi:hypothetical protein
VVPGGTVAAATPQPVAARVAALPPNICAFGDSFAIGPSRTGILQSHKRRSRLAVSRRSGFLPMAARRRPPRPASFAVARAAQLRDDYYSPITNHASPRIQGRGCGVGRDRGVTLGVALGVGLAVAVGVAEGVTDGVGVAVGVPLGVGVTGGVTVGVDVGVALGVGVGVGVPPGTLNL